MGMLTDKVVIVTGGAQGIGLCAAERFAEEGALVAIWDFNTEKGAAAESLLKGKGHDVRFQQVNVTDMASVKGAVETLFRETGKIDVLVNNAGITRDASLLKMTEEQWQQVDKIRILMGDEVSVRTKAKILEGIRRQADEERRIEVQVVNLPLVLVGETLDCRVLTLAAHGNGREALAKRHGATVESCAREAAAPGTKIGDPVVAAGRPQSPGNVRYETGRRDRHSRSVFADSYQHKRHRNLRAPPQACCDCG